MARTEQARGSRRRFLVEAGYAAGAAAIAPRRARVSAAEDHKRQRAPASAPPPSAGHGRRPAAGAGNETGGPAFDFHGASMPHRKGFGDYTADDLARLQTAYGRLKSFSPKDPRILAPDDVRSGMNQANLHAAHWRGSHLEVHLCWWFAVWHRRFLVFYGQILTSLCDDPTGLALPYWDWVDHPEVPNTAYLQSQDHPSPFFDERDPLYDAVRFPKPGTRFQQRNYSNAAYYCSANDLNNQLLTEPGFATFCGGDPSNGGSAGDLEAFPQNNEHIWAGLNDAAHGGQGMDDLTTTVKDSPFFLHHANIDRLFNLRLAQNHPPSPPTTPWHGQRFNSYDADGELYSVTVDDRLTHMAGNYQARQRTFPLVTEPQELALGGPANTFANVALPGVLQAKLAAVPAAPARPRLRPRNEGVQAPHAVPVVLHMFSTGPMPRSPTSTGPASPPP